MLDSGAPKSSHMRGAEAETGRTMCEWRLRLELHRDKCERAGQTEVLKSQDRDIGHVFLSEFPEETKPWHLDLVPPNLWDCEQRGFFHCSSLWSLWKAD